MFHIQQLQFFSKINLKRRCRKGTATMLELIQQTLPERFLTPKYQGFSYCLQMIETTPFIRSIDTLSSHVDLQGQSDVEVYKIFYCSRSKQIYWYLPYKVDGIHLLDFQYTSWTPSPYRGIHLRSQTLVHFEEFLEIRQLNLNEIGDGWARSIWIEDLERQNNKVIEKVATTNPTVPKHVLLALLRDAKAGKESCPISMADYKDCGSLAITNCYHIFDKESLDRWFRSKTTCPSCREETSILYKN